MSQQLQGLIDRIKSEGVDAAQQKALEIERDAKQKAKQVIDDASLQAQKMTIQAKEEIKKMQEATNIALKQSARDTMIAVKQEIHNALEKIINKQFKDTLTADQTVKIIESLVVNGLSKEHSADIRIVLGDSYQEVKESLLAKLQKQMKQPIRIESSSDIARGFTISFDGGRSFFDVTDESLSKYLSSGLSHDMASVFK